MIILNITRIYLVKQQSPITINKYIERRELLFLFHQIDFFQK